MKKIIIVLILTFLLISIGFFMFKQIPEITGRMVLPLADDNGENETFVSRYFYTKAICNGSNYCQDYEIVCEGNEAKSIKATGAAVQHSEDWKDPRDKEYRETLCWTD